MDKGFRLFLFFLSLSLILIYPKLVFSPPVYVINYENGIIESKIDSEIYNAYHTAYPESWVLNSCLIEKNSKEYFIIVCESRWDSKVCNKKYGCRGGMGLWQIVGSTWNETLIRMSKANVCMPQHCWQFYYHPASNDRHEVIFDAECNFRVGLWLFQEDGDIHWKEYSGACFYKKLAEEL